MSIWTTVFAAASVAVALSAHPALAQGIMGNMMSPSMSPPPHPPYQPGCGYSCGPAYYEGQSYERHRSWQTYNGCPPHYAKQHGVCKPYRRY